MKRVMNQWNQAWALLMGAMLVMTLGCEPGVQGNMGNEGEYATQQSELVSLSSGSLAIGSVKSTVASKNTGVVKNSLVQAVQSAPAPSGVKAVQSLSAAKGSKIKISIVDLKACCVLKSGETLNTTVSGCNMAGGALVNAAQCLEEKEICCVPAKGAPLMTSSNDCTEGFAGSIVANEICKSEPVSLCCGFADGTVAFATNIDCAVSGGTQMPISACQEEEEEDICCMTYGGTFVGSQDDCDAKNGVVVPMDVCEPPVAVCCMIDETATVISEEACDEAGGSTISDEMCEEVCCEVDGEPINVAAAECEILGGLFLAPEVCEASTDTICCELSDGPAVLPENDCLAQGGTVTTADACQLCEVDLDPNVSLIVTDQVVLDAFPMEEVMEQLANLGPGGANGQTGTELFQQWWSTQREREPGVDPANHPFCDDNGGTINGFPIECPRPEHELEDLDANSHHATAIVNRFDLAPTNGAHCGEYRIVYAKTPGVLSGRNIIIFEGVLPNPNPGCGLVGCRPVVEFWASLEDESDMAVRAQLLHDFYFQGLAGFEPVVRPESYGLVPAGTPSGQIRTNQFMNFTPEPGEPFQGDDGWSLREFILTESCAGGACEMLVEQTTVKGNPSPSLWDGTSPLSAAYEADYVAQMNLQQPAVEDINNLGMETFEIYNAGESNSQGIGPNGANYSPNASLAAAISNAIPGGSMLDSNDIAARAQAMTCGGCHQTSSGDNLGTQSSIDPDLMWPVQSPIFVHIDENSNLSLALEMPGGFLDRRKQVMEDFLANTCGETCLEDPMIVLVDGAVITQKQLDQAFEVETADFAKEVLEKCGIAGVETDSSDSGTEDTVANQGKGDQAPASEEADQAEEASEEAAAPKSSKAGGKGDANSELETEETPTEEAPADEDLDTDVPAAESAAQQCAASMNQNFESAVQKSVKPTPTDPLKTTLSGSTTH